MVSREQYLLRSLVETNVSWGMPWCPDHFEIEASMMDYFSTMQSDLR
jgi:hypothetical protein